MVRRTQYDEEQEALFGGEAILVGRLGLEGGLGLAGRLLNFWIWLLQIRWMNSSFVLSFHRFSKSAVLGFLYFIGSTSFDSYTHTHTHTHISSAFSILRPVTASKTASRDISKPVEAVERAVGYVWVK